MTENKLTQKLFVEALGTFLLVFLGAGSIVVSSSLGGGSGQLLLVALAHGLALGIAISIAMGISGGHINPAVTAAMYVTKRIGGRDAVSYVIAQLAGAAIGAILLLLMMPAQYVAGSSLGATTLSPYVGVVQGIAIEAIITFILVMSVFGTTVDKRAPKIAGFGVGFTLVALILVAGPLTGAAANPARAFGPELATLNFADWYVYWIGPLIGGVLAGLLYDKFIMGKNRT